MEQLNEVNAWDTPPYSAHAVPILWEPNAFTGERLVAIVALLYEMPQPGASSVHIAFQHSQLKAMLGAKRAQSAYGILEQVSQYVGNQLRNGFALTGLSAPFDGFVTGNPVRVRGYSETQLVDSAIRMLSAFGTRETYANESEVAQRNTVPTSQFLRSLRATFAGQESDRRARFNRKVQLPGAPEITIDYAHNKNIVQVTSLPVSVPHLNALQKEAESKMFELDIAVTLLRKDSADTFPSLLVNTAALDTAITREAASVANELLKRLRFMSLQKEMTLIEAASPMQAAAILDDLEFGPMNGRQALPRAVA